MITPLRVIIALGAPQLGPAAMTSPKIPRP
jgi:hypothetical protein